MPENSAIPAPVDGFRCGYVAVVGWPNVGKSTLLNALLGMKLSIVSPKPQTTRDAVLGILNEPDLQMVFVDTPGWLKPADPFQASMKTTIVRSIHDDADALLWLVEAAPLSAEQKEFGQMIARTAKPLCVAVNKVDMLSEKKAWERTAVDVRAAVGAAVQVFPVSAKTREGVSDLRRALAAHLPPGRPFFPTDQVTDRWERFFTAELIRETIFKAYAQEVPHASAVVIEDFVEKAGQKDRIKAIVFVETEGQKKILIGSGGRSIKDLGQRSRLEIERMLGRPVYLELLVKVRKNWRKDAEFIRRMREGGR